MPRLLSLRHSVALGILAFSACTSSEKGAEHSLTRTDSLGVAIVTSIVPVGDLGPVLSLSSEPRLRIGVEDGAEELLFNEIASVARLEDGRIAIANGTPPAIRLFAMSGEFLGRLGRSGRGPGEFQDLRRLLAGRGDTLLAVNSRFPNFQLMRFSGRTGYVDMLALSRDSVATALDTLRGEVGPREFLRNGSVVIRVSEARETDARWRPAGELYRPRAHLVWLNAGYTRSHVLGTFGEIQQMALDVDGERWPLVPPNARWQHSAVDGRGTRFCLAPNDGPEVHCVDEDGAHLVIRWRQEEVATTEEDIEKRWGPLRQAAERSELPLTSQQVERMIDQAIIPPTKPPVSFVVVDAERRVMVGGPDLQAEIDGWRRVRVFSATGELLGVADLPPVTVHDLGTDYLLGVSRNDDDVEFVVAYEVSQAAPR